MTFANRAEARASFTGLLSLLSLYLLLIVLVLVFANQFFDEVSAGNPSSMNLVLYVAILFPVFLMVFIVVNVVRLVQDRRRKRSGVVFKTRLVVFFIFIVIVSAIPQGVLSVNFVSNALNAWFSPRYGQALRNGLDIALEFYDQRVRLLSQFGTSRLFDSLMRDVAASPQQVWSDIQGLNATIDGFQVFSSEYQEIAHFGDTGTRLQPEQARVAREGFVGKDQSGELSFLRLLRSVNGGERLVVISSVLPPGFDQRAQQITASLETFVQIEELRPVAVAGIVLFFGLFSLPLILLAILVSFFLSEEVIQPIVNLEEATRKVADGDFSFRILSRSGDDLGTLVDSFNRMVVELDRSRFQVQQTERVSAWQEIAQRLAHEIKNPLTPIKLSAERIIRKYRAGATDFGRIIEPSIEAIIGEVNNLLALLTEFSNFARLPAPQPQRQALRPIVQTQVDMYGNGIATTFHLEGLPPDTTVYADAGQLAQVFANLFQNAIDAMAQTGDVFVNADRVFSAGRAYLRVLVRDSGPGIPADHQRLVFNPYYTTKKHGSGLGLAIVERIVFDHNGRIHVESEPQVGTTFTIDLPDEEV